MRPNGLFLELEQTDSESLFDLDEANTIMVAPKDAQTHLYSLGGKWKSPVWLDFVRITCVLNGETLIGEQYFKHGMYVNDNWMQGYSLGIPNYTKGNVYTIVFEGRGMFN